VIPRWGTAQAHPCSGTAYHMGIFVGTINCHLSENRPASRDCATRSITPWGLFALEHSRTLDIGAPFDGADTGISPRLLGTLLTANYTKITPRCCEGASLRPKVFGITDTWRRRLRQNYPFHEGPNGSRARKLVPREKKIARTLKWTRRLQRHFTTDRTTPALPCRAAFKKSAIRSRELALVHQLLT